MRKCRCEHDSARVSTDYRCEWEREREREKGKKKELEQTIRVKQKSQHWRRKNTSPERGEKGTQNYLKFIGSK